MSFARHQFELAQTQDDGSTLLDHLNAAWRASGTVPAMLRDAPKLPDGLESLWLDFIELHGSRGSTGFGVARITFADMKAWQELRRTQLTTREVDLIRKADDIWLNDFAPKPKADK